MKMQMRGKLAPSRSPCFAPINLVLRRTDRNVVTVRKAFSFWAKRSSVLSTDLTTSKLPFSSIHDNTFSGQTDGHARCGMLVHFLKTSMYIYIRRNSLFSCSYRFVFSKHSLSSAYSYYFSLHDIHSSLFRFWKRKRKQSPASASQAIMGQQGKRKRNSCT